MTATIMAREPNISLPSVESQKVAMMASASVPAAGWSVLSIRQAFLGGLITNHWHHDVIMYLCIQC